MWPIDDNKELAWQTNTAHFFSQVTSASSQAEQWYAQNTVHTGITAAGEANGIDYADQRTASTNSSR